MQRATLALKAPLVHKELRAFRVQRATLALKAPREVRVLRAYGAFREFRESTGHRVRRAKRVRVPFMTGWHSQEMKERLLTSSLQH